MSVEVDYPGRFGNNLFQYIFARLWAKRNGLKVVTDFNHPHIVSMIPQLGGVTSIFPSVTEIGEGEWSLNKRWPLGRYLIKGFFQRSSLYYENRKEILEFAHPTSKPLRQSVEDLVVNFRIDSDYRDHLSIHPSWYRKILETEYHRQIFVVSDVKDVEYFKYALGDRKYVWVGGSPKEQWDFLRGFERIIMSNSTFCWWAVFFGRARKAFIFKRWIGNNSVILGGFPRAVEVDGHFLFEKPIDWDGRSELPTLQQSQKELISNKKYLFTTFPSLGDQISFLGAARTYAKLNPGEEVFTTNLPEVVRHYKDELVKPGSSGERKCSDPGRGHRIKNSSPDLNYAGTYLSELGVRFTAAPSIELPEMDPPPGLLRRGYICFQPYSGYSKNMELVKIQALADECKRIYKNSPLVIVGSQSTPRDLVGVDYSYLGGVERILQCIQSAAAVVTPRSASAHISAAYGVPSFVWTPDDGENWHLDYPDWPHYRTSIEQPLESIVKSIVEFLKNVRDGVIQSSGAMKRAFEHSGIPTGPYFFNCKGREAPPGLVDVSKCSSIPEEIRKVIQERTGSEPEKYPHYLNVGNAVGYVLDDALKTCIGNGVDIGPEHWGFPGAILVKNEKDRNAYNLFGIEDASLDFVFSSHVLEHLERQKVVLEEWVRVIRPGGIMFLYLPHPDMEMWRPGGPWVGDHKYVPHPSEVGEMVEAAGMKVVILTKSPDAYWSYRCVARK